MKKRICSLLLVFTLLGSSTIFAAQKTTDVSNISDGWKVTQMSLEEAQKQGLPFIEVETQVEAVELINKINNMSISLEEEPSSESSDSQDTGVQSRVSGLYEKHYKHTLVTIALKTRIEASSTRITSARAYSTLSGITAGINWTENDIDSQITPSGKDYHSWVDGTLSYGIFVGETGIFEWRQQDIYFEDYRMLFR